MKTIISLSVALLLAGAGISCAEILTLRDCLKSAAAGNPSLKAAAFDEKIAREGIDQARSGYLPRVDFQGGYTAQLEPQAISFAGGRAINTQEPDFGFFSLSLYQTIYDFGRTGSRTRRATSLQEATRHAYAGQEKELFLQVVESYYGILMEQKMVQAAQEEVGQMTDHLRVAQHLYEQGVTTRNDLLQAEVKLAASKQSLLMANNRLANNWLRLNYLTGRPPQMQGELDDAPRYRLDADPVDVENALTRRDEIKSLKKTLEADEQAVQESKSGYYPELFAKAGVDYVQNKEVMEQAIMYATVGLKINLFDGLATTSRLRQSVENRSRTGARLHDLEESVRTEYLVARNDAQAAAERIILTEKSIQQGEENLRINRDRYQEQVGTATDVVDAQTLLTQVRTLHYQTLFDFQVAAARVKKALGEL
jgi:outer membrane protein TolC